MLNPLKNLNIIPELIDDNNQLMNQNLDHIKKNTELIESNQKLMINNDNLVKENLQLRQEIHKLLLSTIFLYYSIQN